MKNSIIVVILVLLAVPVEAATYMWEDNQGTVSFSEDLGSIPKQYRKKAKILGEEEDVAPSAPVQTPAAEQKDKGKGDVGEQAAPPEKKKTYGNKSGDAWRREFVQYRGEIKLAEDQLEELNGRMNDTSKLSRNDVRSIQMNIKTYDNKLQRFKGKLETLTDEANRAGVPAEFRGQ
jgi:hypothetical protein